MGDHFVQPQELAAESATLLPDRETLCYIGCVNVQLNLSNITAIQTPIAVSVWGDANSLAQTWADVGQYNTWYSR